MSERKLSEDLYKRATSILEELCDWCGKRGSTDCTECSFADVRTVIELHRRTINIELDEEDLEFICIGLCCYMRRSLKNLKEESQEQVRVTLRKMEKAREEVKTSE